MANEELSNPSEDTIHFARWFLGGFILLSLAQNLNQDDWDGLSLDQFRTQLRQVYGDTMRDWLLSHHIPWLESRGIPVGISANPSNLTEYIRKATQDTRDLHSSMQKSFSTSEFARWGSAANQGAILKDMSRISGDHLEEATTTRLQQDGMLTGRRRWETSGAGSRHAILNRVVTSGREWPFKGGVVNGPRHNPQDPREWSGCNCTLSYEWRDSEDNTGWL